MASPLTAHADDNKTNYRKSPNYPTIVRVRVIQYTCTCRIVLYLAMTQRLVPKLQVLSR